MKTDLFQSCGHCWVFQICWHIECSTFTASSSRIWNSSTGIPSPPLALFIVMLSKTQLTSHSRMSGSRWVGLWISQSLNYLCVSYAYCILHNVEYIIAKITHSIPISLLSSKRNMGESYVKKKMYKKLWDCSLYSYKTTEQPDSQVFIPDKWKSMFTQKYVYECLQ